MGQGPAPDRNYPAWVRAEYPKLIGELELTGPQEHYMNSRWLAEYRSLDKEASVNRLVYYGLKLVAVIGGILLPLIGTLGQSQPWGPSVLALVSAMVAIAVALDALQRPGDRWRHYRHAAELLKTEGWRFMTHAAPYNRYADHTAAFELFALRSEKLLTTEVEEYVASVILPETTGKPT